MRPYRGRHRSYCGVDLHARTRTRGDEDARSTAGAHEISRGPPRARCHEPPRPVPLGSRSRARRPQCGGMEHAHDGDDYLGGRSRRRRPPSPPNSAQPPCESRFVRFNRRVLPRAVMTRVLKAPREALCIGGRVRTESRDDDRLAEGRGRSSDQTRLGVWARLLAASVKNSMSPVATSYIAPTIAIRPSRTSRSSVWLCSQDRLDRPRHVAPGHGVDERLLLGRRAAARRPGTRAGSTDCWMSLDDVVEVLAARGLGGGLARADRGRRPRSRPRTGCAPSPGPASPRPRRSRTRCSPAPSGWSTLPAIRTLKMSPTPRSKISSAGVRESMQLSTTASGCWPAGRGARPAGRGRGSAAGRCGTARARP